MSSLKHTSSVFPTSVFYYVLSLSERKKNRHSLSSVGPHTIWTWATSVNLFMWNWAFILLRITNVLVFFLFFPPLFATLSLSLSVCVYRAPKLHHLESHYTLPSKCQCSEWLCCRSSCLDEMCAGFLVKGHYLAANVPECWVQLGWAVWYFEKLKRP